jgi:acyl-CoA thioester hydrolase
VNRIFTCTKRVEYAHTDMSGIVHFSQFFHYMEEAEHEFFRSLGFSINYPTPEGLVSWPRASCHFDFKKPLRFEQVVQINIQITRLGKRSLTYRATVTDQAEVMAVGTATIVCCRLDGANITSVDLPDPIRQALSPWVDQERQNGDTA